MIYINNKHHEKFPTTLLEFMVTYNSSVTTLYYEVISEINSSLFWVSTFGHGAQMWLIL